MNYGYIIFMDKEEKPLRISQKEYDAIMLAWQKATHIVVQGQPINKFDIRRVKPPQKPEPLGLPPVTTKPVSRDFLDKLKKQISERFSL